MMGYTENTMLREVEEAKMENKDACDCHRGAGTAVFSRVADQTYEQKSRTSSHTDLLKDIVPFGQEQVPKFANEAAKLHDAVRCNVRTTSGTPPWAERKRKEKKRKGEGKKKENIADRPRLRF